ncbi:MAG: Smr/MutS family protein [Clostridiales bacterium]|nr:Smr/MutS family protein [Clostridiales bacterium]
MAGYKTVNLEQGMPTADRAIRRLTYELAAARQMRYTAVKLIHGYGSSGRGGVLRTEIRDYLLRIHSRGQIQAFIGGERFSIFDEDTRIAMELCPELRRDRDLDRHNNGITVVIL